MGYPYPYFCLCAFLGPYKTTKSSGLGSTMSVVWALEMTGFMTYWVLRNVHQVVNFICVHAARLWLIVLSQWGCCQGTYFKFPIAV